MNMLKKSASLAPILKKTRDLQAGGEARGKVALILYH